jgi:hypothetical protein
VFVNVIVQGVDPDPVADVLLAVPVQAVYCVPVPAALPLLAVKFVMSVATLDKIATTFPVTGAVLVVMACPV